MELTIVNPHPKYPRVGLIEPPPTGYLLLAAVVEPTVGRTPFPRGGSRKAACWPSSRRWRPASNGSRP